MLVINRMKGTWKVVDTRYHADTALDDLGKSALNDCCDLFQQYYRRVGHTGWQADTGQQKRKHPGDLTKDDLLRSSFSSTMESTLREKAGKNPPIS